MAKPRMENSERVIRFWSRVSKQKSGCWVWIGATNGPGYGKFYDGTKVEMAHRFSFILAHGSIDPGQFICHRCDNPPCVNPEHLFVGSQSDNLRDAYSKGRMAICKLNASGRGNQIKLTIYDVREIRLRHRRGETQTSIAEDFEINQTMVSAIVRNKSWASVK